MASTLAAVAFVTALVVGGHSTGLQSYVIGPLGHQIRLLAQAGQHVSQAKPGGRSAGTSVLPGATNYSTRLTLPNGGTVEIAISVPPRTVAPAHARWIINDYFNNDPEKRTTWHGLPGDLGVRSCNTPAGACPGYQGGLQVFRGGALFNVVVGTNSSSDAWALLRSVQIPTRQ